MNYEVFPVLLVWTNTVSCVSVVYSLLFFGWLSSLPVVVTMYAWTDLCSHEYSRETFCKSLEFSLCSSLLFVCILQILLALISSDSQEYLLTLLPGCRVPLPSARPGSSQGNTLGNCNTLFSSHHHCQGSPYFIACCPVSWKSLVHVFCLFLLLFTFGRMANPVSVISLGHKQNLKSLSLFFLVFFIMSNFSELILPFVVNLYH